ncbi:MAG TPA: ABC transporter permease [Vicinamibacterales bacterium]|nr:ABC transporter permease [Vicinamibacterales bacterium]
MLPALRRLVRQPSFALAAVGTLALGIATATALFSTVNAVLLTPLPYAHPKDLYTVRTYFPSGRFTIGLVASEELGALEASSRAVVATAGAVRMDAALTTDVSARQVVAYGVTDGFFDLFGLPMAAGRAIGPADDVRGAPPVVVLSHALWSTQYGARRDVVGSTILLRDHAVRVVGVAAPDFDEPAGTDVWFNTYAAPDDIGHYFEGYVRLKPGTSLDSLRVPMEGTMAALGRKHPDQDLGRAYRLRPLLEATVGDFGPILLILFGATGLLLVLAVVNVTNLMLARSTGRAREIAVRAALGASRRRILVHLVAESLLLSAVGGVVGLAGAYAAVRVLLRIGGSRLPRLDALTFDVTVVGFAAALAIASGLLVGIVPALRLARGDIARVMNDTGRSVRGSRTTRRLLAVFVTAEIAVAVALVAGASRLVRSYDRLQRIDPGFTADGRLAIDVLLPQAYGNPARHAAWWQSVEARLRGAGATHVAAASSLPLAHEWDSTTFVDILSEPGIPPDKRPNGRLRLVTPGFFSTMGMRLLAGRAFTGDDRLDSQPVAIVNEVFVKRYLEGRDPLRERIEGFRYHVVDRRPVPDAVAIVGVAADVKYAALTAAAEPVVYVPMSQYFNLRASIVVTTADGHPERRAGQFRAALHDADPKVPARFSSLTALVASSLDRQRLGMWLMSGFGIAALLLAMVGVFGVVAYVVAQRTGEMAIRQALGATRPQVFWMIVRDGGRVAAIGIAAGLLIAWWTGRLIGGYLYDVRPGDPVVLAGSALVVAVVALSATLVPARRAAAVELARSLGKEA